MIEINVAAAILGALLHAGIVVVGIYIAMNTRLTRLETKMEIVWQSLREWMQKNGKRG